MEAFADMTLSQIISWAAGIIALLSIFIEVTPIKINPVSALFGWMGRKITGDLLAKVNDLEDKVNGLESTVKARAAKDDEQEAINCRRDILAFGDEVCRGVKHSHEHFNQVLEDIDVYERYCLEHKDFENNKTVATKQRILDVYNTCLGQNDFL